MVDLDPCYGSVPTSECMVTHRVRVLRAVAAGAFFQQVGEVGRGRRQNNLIVAIC